MNTAANIASALETSSILNEMNQKSSAWDEIVTVSKNEAILGENTNLAAAIAGVGLAVGLELISTNGNKASAITAAAAGGLAVYAGKDVLRGYQSTGSAVAACLVSYKLAAIAGRTVANYFPKVDVVERVIEVPAKEAE